MGENDGVMPFLTGGLVAAHAEVEARGMSTLDPLVSNSGWGMSWTVGGGIEFAVSDDATLKAEYLYTDLSGALNAAPISPVNPDSTARFDISANHLIRIGMNAHF
jgi:outer membrane immunogenic protein